MIGKSTLFLIGWMLIPTPPSPVPDFGLQFIAVLIIGALAPKFLIRPVNIFAEYLGLVCKWFFGKIPGIRVIVEKTDQAIKKFESSVAKKREFENRVAQFLYNLIVKEDFFQRIIFGYFVTIVVGSTLVGISLFI